MTVMTTLTFSKRMAIFLTTNLMITVKTKIIVMVRFPAGEVADSTLSLGEYIIYNIPLHILGEYVFLQFAFGDFKTWLLRRYTH